MGGGPKSPACNIKALLPTHKDRFTLRISQQCFFHPVLAGNREEGGQYKHSLYSYIYEEIE